ncbi:MAG: FAD-dependent oxidoreductase [Chloroflexi bacterium]|nr:FAD-dependent oxidoreductase [Chloroflexota bacterium]
MRTHWNEEADVVVVGYGGAGVAAAISAHDSGARVLILEKQPCDTPDRTNHTPSTRLAGGGWWTPRDPERALTYMLAMTRAANETIDQERTELLSVFAKYLVSNTEWMKGMGVELGGSESLAHGSRLSVLTPEERSLVAAGEMAYGDYPNLPGAQEGFMAFPKISGQYRNGAALFKYLSEAVDKRKIPIMWGAPARRLITGSGEVLGVVAASAGKEVAIKATRAVVLTCGGFEFNPGMKENFLRVNPSHFYGTPASTGDGVSMTQEIGAALWHMNNASWRAVMKFPGLPVAMGTRNHETAVFVDRIGRRFSRERYQAHAFGYELTNFDAHILAYPRVPCYLVFDEKRKREGCLASYHGVCNPPGGIIGDMFYRWSEDNQAEIDRGWIMRASTIEGLARLILADPDNGDLMTPSVLRDTIRRYDGLCREGVDADFSKPAKWLQPLEDPPYYAVKLWPGGPNTQGGPKRNSRGQVLRVSNTPIPRLYSAGELGSVWGMIYQGGGNIAECMAFGRISGVNAASEKPWKTAR